MLPIIHDKHIMVRSIVMGSNPLSSGARLLDGIIYTRSNLVGEICVSISVEDMADQLNVSTRQCERYLRELTDNSYLVIEKVPGSVNNYYPDKPKPRGPRVYR